MMDSGMVRWWSLAAPVLLLLVGCAPGIDRVGPDAPASGDSGAPPQDAGGGGPPADGGSPSDPGASGKDPGAGQDPGPSGGGDGAGQDPGPSGGGDGAGQDPGPSGGGDGAGQDPGGGTSAPARPSAGCGKAGRPSGGSVVVANDHIYTFPTTYDGTRPFPLLMGFHAASNPIDQIRTLTNGSDFEKSYVRAFGKSAGSAWSYGTDLKKVIAIYDDLMANNCIDMGREFATGHSSGAQMIVQILTRPADARRFNFKAVAPVAASNYGAIVSPIPVMYIQGARDSVRNSNGADVVAQFTKANTCATTTVPYTKVDTCSSSGAAVKPGCIEYQSCAQPTLWCSHDDKAYGGTSHGWPCFATKAMYDFFTGLP